jgi:glycosyltransferase involved in cell wall biosynthesis
LCFCEITTRDCGYLVKLIDNATGGRSRAMNVLFVHNNFPAQFRHLITALARVPGVNLAAIGSRTATAFQGVRPIKYALHGADLSETHPFARRFDMECRRAEQVLYGLSNLVTSGFKPDVIFAHPGWGETLPLRTIFPEARLLLYCEYYYGAPEGDLGFDPEFPMSGLDGHVAVRLKNATTLLGLADCNLGISPMAWQRSTFPAHYQSKIEVAHDGIDCARAKPDVNAVLSLPSGRRLTRENEVVTFVARNLEPVRGYHIFMRTLPDILARRPKAEVVIVGGDGTSYGAAAPAETTWKSIFLKEVESRIDADRVHFLSRVPYETYLKVLQVSTAHVYLTYPFVLSWSMLEAMSAGCLVIGSDTPPVREVIDASTGILVSFFDVEQWTDRIVEVLDNRERFAPMREAARRLVTANFDAQTICVPRLMQLLRIEGDTPTASSQRNTTPKVLTKEAPASRTETIRQSKTEPPPIEWAPPVRSQNRTTSRA